MKHILSLSLLFLSGACCPQGGVDRTRHIDSFIVAFDKVKSGTAETTYKAKITSTDGRKFEEKNYIRSTNTDKIEFHFPGQLVENQIDSIKVESFDEESEELRSGSWKFDDLSTEVYQIAPEAIASTSKSSFLNNAMLCTLDRVDNFLFPKAQAMSCKAKKGSMIYYKPGIRIIYVDLANDLKTVEKD